MQNPRATQSIRQMFQALAGFVVAITLLESDGLVNWADRLEPGPLRSVSVPATAALHKLVKPLAVGAMRERALDLAARIRWTDDAVWLAHSTKPLPAATSQQAACEAPAPVQPPVTSAAAVAPLVAVVPSATPLSPLAPVEQGKARVVALAGDSMMAVGFSASLMRLAADDSNLRIVKAFKSGTGLARPDVFNWMDEYPAMIGSEKPDVVIVALGANDSQGFEVDGQVQLFGTAEWLKTYQSRVADFLAMVESGGARVVWVGLPPMRAETYNQKVAVINRIVYTAVSQDPRATWWNSAPFVADESGGFREFASLKDGRIMRLRAADGIHFSDDGAGLMSSALMKWLDPPLETTAATPTPSQTVSSSGSFPIEAGTAVAVIPDPLAAMSHVSEQKTRTSAKVVRPVGF